MISFHRLCLLLLFSSAVLVSALPKTEKHETATVAAEKNTEEVCDERCRQEVPLEKMLRTGNVDAVRKTFDRIKREVEDSMTNSTFFSSLGSLLGVKGNSFFAWISRIFELVRYWVLGLLGTPGY